MMGATERRCVSWEEKSVMRLNVVEFFLGAGNSRQPGIVAANVNPLRISSATADVTCHRQFVAALKRNKTKLHPSLPAASLIVTGDTILTITKTLEN